MCKSLLVFHCNYVAVCSNIKPDDSMKILILIVVRTYPRVCPRRCGTRCRGKTACGEAAAYAAKRQATRQSRRPRGEAAALRHVAAKPRAAKPSII